MDSRAELDDEAISDGECIYNGTIRISQCYHKTIRSSKYRQLKQNIMDMKKQCGRLCNDASSTQSENDGGKNCFYRG